MFKKYDGFEIKDYRNLYSYCKKKKIDFLSTPFDEDAVDFLEPMVPYFKIASADITNFPLLKKIGQKKKITFLSTGASNIKEIKNAINILKKNGSPMIVLLHCILNYPTKTNLANLKMISHLRSNFPKNLIGYSDHTLPSKQMESLTAAYLLGAKVLEKHFTLNKLKKGNDHYHSMDYFDLLEFNKKIKIFNSLIGNSKTKIPLSEEMISRKNARRSIVVKKFIQKGEKISEKKLIAKRPGTGISPMYWKKILGKKATKNLKEDEIIKMISDFK